MLPRCVLLGTIFAACGGEPAPTWTELARAELGPKPAGERMPWRERIRAAHRTTLTKEWYDVPL